MWGVPHTHASQVLETMKNCKIDTSGIEMALSFIAIAILCLQMTTCMGMNDIQREIRQVKYEIRHSK